MTHKKCLAEVVLDISSYLDSIKNKPAATSIRQEFKSHRQEKKEKNRCSSFDDDIETLVER